VDANAELGAHPEIVNESPYQKGWLFKLKLANKGELKELLASAVYKKSAGV
jgi:glycine cleavage system H protein